MAERSWSSPGDSGTSALLSSSVTVEVGSPPGKDFSHSVSTLDDDSIMEIDPVDRPDSRKENRDPLVKVVSPAGGVDRSKSPSPG